MTKLATFRNFADTKIGEPALRTGTNISVVAGALSVFAFIFPNLISEKYSTIILVVAAFLLPIITALFTRKHVWSAASVAELINEAVAEAEEVIANKKLK